MSNRIELCCLCQEPTGRAGRLEDSIYIDLPNCELVPLCESCQHGIEEQCAEYTGMNDEIKQLRAENERLTAELAAMTAKFESERAENTSVQCYAEDIKAENVRLENVIMEAGNKNEWLTSLIIASQKPTESMNEWIARLTNELILMVRCYHGDRERERAADR